MLPSEEVKADGLPFPVWAAFLAFGPVWLAHWLTAKKEKSGTRGPGTGHLTNDQSFTPVRTRGRRFVP